MPPLLSVNDLTVSYPQRGGEASSIATRAVSFQVEPGEILGLVGGVGAGKSTILRTLAGLLPPGAGVFSGEVKLDPETAGWKDLLKLRVRAWRRLMRQRIAYFTGDSTDFWNPRRTVRQHIRETLQLAGLKREARVEANWMPIFYEVGLIEPENLLARYPSQLPELTRFRFQMAMALMKHADLWVADEPTACLDATGEDQILRLLRELCEKHQFALVVATQHFGIIERLADQVAVLFEGGVVESGKVSATVRRSKNPYTRALLKCRPRLNKRRRSRLPEVDRAAEQDAIDATRGVAE